MSFIDTITKNPIPVAIGVVVLLLIVSRGKGGGVSGFEATLASQKTASDTNVALAGIQAQREASANMLQAAAFNARKDIVLSAHQVAIADKSITTDLAIEKMRNTTANTASNAGFLVDILSMATGAKIARDQNVLTAQSIAADKETTLAQISASKQLGFSQSDISLASTKLNNQLATLSLQLQDLQNEREIGFDYFALPQEIDLQRFTVAEREATTRNLAWRAKQIAGKQMLGQLLGNLMGGTFGLASQALDLRR